MPLEIRVVADPSSARLSATGRPQLAPGITDIRPDRGGPFEQLAQLSRAAESAGIAGLVVPLDLDGVDSTIAAGDLLRHSRYQQVIAELGYCFATPVYAAKIGVTMQRTWGSRLGWRVDPVGTWKGEHARLAEFIEIARGVWHERPYSFVGEYYEALESGFAPPLAGYPFPRVEVVGADADSIALGAKQGDIQIVATDKLEDSVAAVAEAGDHDVAVGIDLALVARPTAEQAKLDAQRLDAPADALVGSYEQCSEALAQFAQRGVGVINVLSARPIEDTYRLGEHVLAPLIADGLISSKLAARS